MCPVKNSATQLPTSAIFIVYNSQFRGIKDFLHTQKTTGPLFRIILPAHYVICIIIFPLGKLVSIYVCCHLNITFSTLTVCCYSCCTKSSHLQNRNRSLQTSIIARCPQGKLVSIYVCCHLNITFSTLRVCCYSCCTKSSHLRNRTRSLQTSRFPDFLRKLTHSQLLHFSYSCRNKSNTNTNPNKQENTTLISLFVTCSLQLWWEPLVVNLASALERLLSLQLSSSLFYGVLFDPQRNCPTKQRTKTTLEILTSKQLRTSSRFAGDWIARYVDCLGSYHLFKLLKLLCYLRFMIIINNYQSM